MADSFPVKPLVWDTSIQGTQTLVPKNQNVLIIFVLVTSKKGTPPFS